MSNISHLLFRWTRNFCRYPARTYLLDIENAQNRIAEFPLSGADFESPGRPNLKRMISSTGYSVFYELDSPTQPSIAVIISIIRGQEQQP
jgi:plasmid stabilization system protein ParE